MTYAEKKSLWLTGILILVSRLPFLFDGYGSEEDAWALRLVAERIGTSGVYEVSRLPGHPFQELVYSLIWKSGPMSFILLTLCISTAGILAFQRSLQMLGIKQSAYLALGLAITPMVYINSSNVMDYTWAMGFNLMAFLGVLQRRVFLAGLFIALATGCRITSGAMLLPLSILLWQLADKSTRRRELTTFICTTLGLSLLVFLPVIRQYGISFFTYYEHFPIPGFAKNFYKGSFAVWGVVGFMAVIWLFLETAKKYKRLDSSYVDQQLSAQQLIQFCLLVIALYGIAFAKMPLKAAFMIPLIPYVWLLAGLIFSPKKQVAFVLLMFLSAFSFGINLSDPLRGSKKSALAIEASIGGQQVAFDLLEGPVVADQTKRQQRTAYAKKVLSQCDTIQQPTFILAGWWLADLLVLQRGKERDDLIFRYYTEESELQKYRAAGFQLYYLPEQEVFNDLRFQGHFTTAYMQPFPSGEQRR